MGCRAIVREGDSLPRNPGYRPIMEPLARTPRRRPFPAPAVAAGLAAALLLAGCTGPGDTHPSSTNAAGPISPTSPQAIASTPDSTQAAAPSGAPDSAAPTPVATATQVKRNLEDLRRLEAPTKATFVGEGRPLRMVLDHTAVTHFASTVTLDPRLNTAILVTCTQETTVAVRLTTNNEDGMTSGATQCLAEGGGWSSTSLRAQRAKLSIQAPDGVGFRVWVWQYRQGS